MIFRSVIAEIMAGRHPGWIEDLHQRKDLYHNNVYATHSSAMDGEPWPPTAIRWSSLGGSAEEDDAYLLGIAALRDPAFLIPAKALIELLETLLEKSGLDARTTPPPLGPFDPNADYALIQPPPPRPPPPLHENKHLLRDLHWRLDRLADLQKEDAVAAHQARVTLLNEMKELGIFREDLIGSHDAGIANAQHLSRFLSKIDELRKYYASAHRKSALGTTAVPNVLGGPLSYQLIDQTRGWDFGDHHPHEIFAQLESLMRKQSDLEGDFGERKVEDGTFKATFHWEREDGIHASLTKVIVESW